MSTSDLYSVYKTKTKHLAEFPNGHGTAPVIWGYLCEKYLGQEKIAWLHGHDNKKLWDLVWDNNVPKDFRIVHAFTFDHAVCPNDKIKDLAESCLSVYQKTIDPTQVNHWENIGNFLKSFKPISRSKGVGLSCTSVCDNWIGWGRYVKIKGDNSWNIFSIFDA